MSKMLEVTETMTKEPWKKGIHKNKKTRKTKDYW